ncbi:hypothetical protein BGW80DRAFT_1399032 [Lactifluus volemus]|nr:hypothetical protein BGW80DRAFT_1399032 [Lactifluus volemus]
MTNSYNSTRLQVGMVVTQAQTAIKMAGFSLEIVALATARIGNAPLTAESVIMTTNQSLFLIFSSTFSHVCYI